MIRLARTVWYVLTLRCEEADRVRAVGRREDLTRAERFGAWAHTRLCASCRRARRQVRILERLLRDLSETPPPGPGLPESARRRIADSIEKEPG